VNRRQRRANHRHGLARRIRQLEHKVQTTGRPGILHGLTGACRDCTATGDLVLYPDNRAVGHIYHDDGCPAGAGITSWEPHAIT
jgi:hypothetical protein